MKKFLIKVNGNQYEVEVEEVKVENVAAKTVEPVKAAPIATVAAPAPKPAVQDKIATAPAGATTITSPMPGTILKVNVNTGDAVKKGQVLLILEAMKMENEITSHVDGIVAEIKVAKGACVSANDILVVIK